MKFIEKYQKIFALCGMIGPFFYAMIWILGGILQPGYNHITDDVSTLLAVGAPNKLLFDLMEATYGILMIIFFASLHWTINKGKGSILGPGAFLVNFVLHVVAVFFPLDAGGEITTLRGKMHLVLVVTSGLLTIAGMVALWFRLEFVEGWSTFATYSLISAIASFILIIISAIFIKSRYRGVLERFGVSPFQIYYFIISLMVFLSN